MANKKLCTKSSVSVAAAELKDVDDLLVEIFLRLPFHSIKRFETASKHWHSLLTDPTFRKLVSNRKLGPPTGLILLTKVPVSAIPIPTSSRIILPPLRTKPKIKQSCNGLFLCSNTAGYHVYNPTTGKSFTLPKLQLSPHAKIRSTTLAFDPDIFGPTYKLIVCVASSQGNWVDEIHVYSSETGHWELVKLKEFEVVNDKGVYWNGSVHWMYTSKYFDIRNEKFNEMPYPQGSWRKSYYVGASCNRLTLTKLWKDKEGASESVDVHELKRDYSEWVLKYRAVLGNLSDVTLVISVVHSVDEAGSFLVLKTSSGIVRSYLASNVSEKLPLSLARGFIDTAFQYIECLYDV